MSAHFIALLLVIVLISAVFVNELAFYVKQVKGETWIERHGACSNKEKVCIGSGCRERSEKVPKQKPPVPTTPTPEPPFRQTTQTTTTAPANYEVRCASTNDCNIGFVCCQNVCKKESEGICRDVNGDGIPDWLVYIV
jgi:hypothetical protein